MHTLSSLQIRKPFNVERVISTVTMRIKNGRNGCGNFLRVKNDNILSIVMRVVKRLRSPGIGTIGTITGSWFSDVWVGILSECHNRQKKEQGKESFHVFGIGVRIVR